MRELKNARTMGRRMKGIVKEVKRSKVKSTISAPLPSLKLTRSCGERWIGLGLKK